jgi:tetratricopeptide (TPR) repeat protein
METISSLQEKALAAQRASDYVTLRRTAAELRAVAEAMGDRSAIAWAEFFTGIALINANDANGAQRALHEAIRLFNETGDRFAAARAMMNLGTIEVDINLDAREARRLYEAAAPVIREMNEPWRLAIALGNLCEIYRLEGEYERAIAVAGESTQIFRSIGDRARACWQLANVALCRLMRREVAAAIETMREAHDEIVCDRNPRWTAWYFDTWFIIAAKLDSWEIAAQLLGFVDRLRDESSVPRLPGVLPWFSTPIERLSKALPDDRANELALMGESLTFEEAEALARTLPS